MKIVVALGSPRPEGNCAVLAQKVCDAAEGRGAEVRKFFVNKMDFKACQGCESCKTTSDRCILEDELTEVLGAIKEADTLVLASPVNWGDISGRLKCFFDRTYSYLNPDFSSRLPGGKKAVLILLQAEPEEGEVDDIFPRYEHWLRLYGFSPIYRLGATGVRFPGDIKRQTRILKQAAALGRELVAPAA
ncbi:MAG: flavodoxin family protein [Desulfobaccales bacterium]